MNGSRQSFLFLMKTKPHHQINAITPPRELREASLDGPRTRLMQLGVERCPALRFHTASRTSA